ncbi:MAG: hypothetical protein AUI14_03360 [Actinobacteria bacterium 13_2_20CM_2_71_6]|nr:MAG: hypothetical protein AUI14_03360 [Actinobacteria bacterium 13_2_20CM_2_71_6]
MSPFIVTVQVAPVPVQAPPQPANTKAVVGFAVNVTGVPASVIAVQVGGHAMPGPDTVPPPAGTETVSVGRRAVIWIDSEAVATRPFAKVAFTLTWYVCAAPQRWVVTRPVAFCPLPRFQRALAGCWLPPATTFSAMSSPTWAVCLDSEIRTVYGGSGLFAGSCAGAVAESGGVLAGGWLGPSPVVPVRPLDGSFGSYLAIGRTPPSSRSTPACSLLGSLKNTTPSRVSSWNRVCGSRIFGCAMTRDCCRSTIHTLPLE